MKSKRLNWLGIFVQIGLLPNTDFLKETAVELSNRGEIVINDRNETNVKGVFCCRSLYNSTLQNKSSLRQVKARKHHYLLSITLSVRVNKRKASVFRETRWPC